MKKSIGINILHLRTLIETNICNEKSFLINNETYENHYFFMKLLFYHKTTILLKKKNSKIYILRKT